MNYNEVSRRGNRYKEVYGQLNGYTDEGVPVYIRGYTFPTEICAQILACHERESYMEEKIYNQSRLSRIEMVNYDIVVSK